MERQNRQVKPFDSTMCFTFFGNWVESIGILETEADRNSPAYMLFKAIADYSMYSKEPDFSQSVNMSFQILWPILSKQIEDSVRNRGRWFGGGITDTQQRVLDAYRKEPNASIRQIEKLAGVSKSTVEYTRRKFEDEIKQIIESGATAGSSPVGSDCDNGSSYSCADGNVSPSVNGNDSSNYIVRTGQNQDRTGQDSCNANIGTGQDSTIQSCSGDNFQQEDMFADLTDDDGELPF